LGGLIIRVAAVAMVGYVLLMVWRHLPYPGWSLLLAIALAVKDGVIIAWWLRQHRLDPRSLCLDLPAGAVALVVGTGLTGPHGPLGWLLYVYPYTLLVTVALGLACDRLISALASASLWAASLVAALVILYGEPLPTTLTISVAYLISTCVGWGCARLLRRNADELEAARAAAVRETADLAATEQRARLSTALHDRILQTLETLSRGGALRDEALATHRADGRVATSVRGDRPVGSIGRCRDRARCRCSRCPTGRPRGRGERCQAPDGRVDRRPRPRTT
jgi:signal transduction histidine kinase